MNKVILIGKLKADPKCFLTSNNLLQARFVLEVQDEYNKQEVHPFSCVAWGSVAEKIQKFILAYTLVAIEGRLVVRSFRDRDFKEVKLTEIIIQNIKIINKDDNR